MARRGIRQKEGEDFSPAKIEEVIKLLGQEKPVTKKYACDVLKIAYNTTRLGRIIEEYIEHKEFLKLRRKQVRNTEITKADVNTVCSMYLSGDPLVDIEEATFRSSSVIKRILFQHNIPLRNASHTYWNPPLLSDDSFAEDYNKGDLVYSAKYQSIATIDGLGKETNNHGMVYPIHISGDKERFAYSASYDLADLRILQRDFGVHAINMSRDEIIQTINETMAKANKNKRKHGDF